jgi:hypothetical protein
MVILKEPEIAVSEYEYLEYPCPPILKKADGNIDYEAQEKRANERAAKIREYWVGRKLKFLAARECDKYLNTPSFLIPAGTVLTIKDIWETGFNYSMGAEYDKYLENPAQDNYIRVVFVVEYKGKDIDIWGIESFLSLNSYEFVD